MFQSIVVGTDGSPTAAEAVRRAAELARGTGATLHLVSAYKPMHGAKVAGGGASEQWQVAAHANVEAILRDAVTPLGNDLNIETYERTGDPADAILDVAETQGADLIVVGNKGMTGAKRYLLGSVPNKVAHHSPCSVMIVHTTG
jgi:nucleotide-binding universal stress UspA family protein